MSLITSLIALSTNALLIIAGLFGIGFLIGFHELGHFIFCKIFRVHTPSFSIGMGPRLWTKKIGDTIFTLSAIPLGGYVEIAGTEEVGQGEQKYAQSRDQYSFAVKPYWQKLLIMAGGILFNMVFTYVTFIALFMTGIPKTPIVYPMNAKPIIRTILPNTAAAKSALQTGDEIISIGNTSIHGNTALLLQKIRELANKKSTVTIERTGAQKSIDITIGTNHINKLGSLGVVFEQKNIKPQSFTNAIKQGISATHLSVWRIWQTIKVIFTQKRVDSVGGPLQVIAETIKGARKGLKIFFAFLAFISVNLAILNVLPLPIFDGGQILFFSIEAIIRRPLLEKGKLIIHYICWIGIMLLIAYLSIKDIWRIFGW